MFFIAMSSYLRWPIESDIHSSENTSDKDFPRPWPWNGPDRYSPLPGPYCEKWLYNLLNQNPGLQNDSKKD